MVPLKISRMAILTDDDGFQWLRQKQRKPIHCEQRLFATKRNKRSSDLPSGFDRKDKSHYRPTKWVLRSFDSLLYLLIFRNKCNLSQVSLGLIVS